MPYPTERWIINTLRKKPRNWLLNVKKINKIELEGEKTNEEKERAKEGEKATEEKKAREKEKKAEEEEKAREEEEPREEEEKMSGTEWNENFTNKLEIWTDLNLQLENKLLRAQNFELNYKIKELNSMVQHLEWKIHRMEIEKQLEATLVHKV